MRSIKKIVVIGLMVLITLGSLISPAVFSITIKEEEEMSRKMMAMIYQRGLLGSPRNIP